jgi:hypothetical protein
MEAVRLKPGRIANLSEPAKSAIDQRPKPLKTEQQGMIL